VPSCYDDSVDWSPYRSVQSTAPPLRIGLLLNSAVLPRCFAEVVDQISQSDFAKVELLVFYSGAVAKTEQVQPRRSVLRKLITTLSDRRRRRRILFALYERWDRRNADPKNDPLAPVDCSARFAGVESLSVTPITKRFVHRFPVEAIDQIRARNLDVLICFGFNILHGEILQAAKYGIWSYHHGDNDYYRGGPAYFWELYENNPVSGAILQVLTEDLDAGRVLYKGHFATEPGFSLERNRVQPYWGASTFMIQKLWELRKHGWDHVERNIVKPAPYLGRKKIYTAPTNAEMLRWLAPLMIRKSAARAVRAPKIPHWRLAIRHGGLPVSTSPAADLRGFRWIESPKGRYYADPFLIEAEGITWVFFEDFDYSLGRATISCAEVREGKLSTPITALERPYHLSYPCVFRDGNQWYMVPETAKNGTVELYRCARFPDRWELDRVLLKTRAVDTTVWAEAGLVWFFVTIQEPRGGASGLWLFSAESAAGEWTPHPANPISTDVRKSRGGGAIFRRDGKLFRPSQDCSGFYGRAFALNEIVVLNPWEYCEKPYVIVEPTWAKGLVGTHTYSRAGEFEIIDGCTRLPEGGVVGR